MRWWTQFALDSPPHAIRLSTRPVSTFSALPAVDPLRRLPAHVLNGTTVSMGIGLVYLLFRACADPHVAQLAICGAIYASLADVPDTPSRSWRQVLAAGALGCAASLVILLLKPFTLALGGGVMFVVFIAMLTLAWGPRAGPISFAPVLSIVFAIGFPAHQDPFKTVAWHLLGLAAYLPWSFAAASLLQPRYRSLALAAALAAAARLLRSRASALDGATGGEIRASALEEWVHDEAALAERLQTARNLLFAARETPRAQRETAVFLRIVDMRDILLASSLDLDLMGNDVVAQQVRTALASLLRETADAVDASRRLLRGGVMTTPSACGEYTVARVFGELQMPAGDARARLLPAIVNRLRHIGTNVDRMHALLCGEQETLPLSHAELQHFVAPEDWPLGVLREHTSIDSPVMRHAVRAALALGCAYYLALLLPWTMYPQWLVLGVAVVLRGNLQQTLARRNARIGGTVLGCVLVLLLSRISSPDVLMLVFVIAIGFAHGFVVERYLVTAVAATVMALLQAHLVAPAIGFPIGERLADTMLGALLAWAFSYVLPFWERRSLPQAIAGALRALQDYARHALHTDAESKVAQRLARRRAYDMLGVIATALGRSEVEPARVRLPQRELVLLLDYGHRLMAHLSMIRLLLTHRGAELDRPEAAAALESAERALCASLTPDRSTDLLVPALVPLAQDMLPAEPPAQNALPWLLWRLHVAVHDGSKAASAAQAALARLAGHRARSGQT